METGSFVAVMSVVLAVVLMVFGAKYRQMLNRTKIFAQLLENIIVATEDNKVTEEEFQNIVASTKKLISEGEF
jgi:predicted YcjX-like family ATPase